MADQLLTGTTLIEDTRKEFGRVWSIPGCGFIPKQSDINDVSVDTDRGNFVATAAGIDFVAAVTLPHGVKIKSVIVNGTDITDTWYLRRMTLAALPGAADTMATAAFNTEDITIINDVVDNISYAYFLYAAVADAGDRVWGARIIYE